MRIARVRAWITRTAFRTPVTWTTGGREEAAVHLWLEVTGATGPVGLSETPVKPAWTGLDGDTALAAVRHLLAPRLLGACPGAAMAGIRGQGALHAAVEHALADLAGPGEAVTAPVTVVLTRAAPEAMAAAAQEAVERHGVRALKVKAGQGLDADAAALRAVRAVLGADGALSLDANGAYGVEDGLALTRIAAEAGAAFVEDPWPLAPDAATQTAVARAACPVAADRMAADPALTDGLLDRGIAWLAVKPNRTGPQVAARIARTARARGGRVVSGLFGEGALGALQQIRGVASDAAVEAAHFLTLADPIPVRGLTLAQGNLGAPGGRASDLVDRGDIADRATAMWEGP